ncbi:MAG: copper amine oxidase N-terminal domain-containing protein [Peptococcaceae bacterium]|nr:copper amine oxidase N-terminal domain-containing protein [Peptococcaceae bacterium]
MTKTSKRFIILMITVIFTLAVSTLCLAEIKTDPNSGELPLPPPESIDNGFITLTPVTSENSEKPAPRNITIIVNGTKITPDVPPYIYNDRTMVPYRFIAEALGCQVEWDDRAKKVTATKDGHRIWMIIGRRQISVDQQLKTIDVAPEIKNERTFIPVRAMSEALGYKVSWDDATSTVYISEN